jgi:hypothetical protein
MLTIRDAQVHALVAPRRRAYLESMLELVRRKHAAHVDDLADGVVLGRMAGALDRAARHGLEDGESLGRFVELGALFGEHFDTEPWAAPILAELAVHGAERTMRYLHATGLLMLDV